MNTNLNPNQTKQVALSAFNTIHKDMFVNRAQFSFAAKQMVEANIHSMHFQVMQHVRFPNLLNVMCEDKKMKFIGVFSVKDNHLSGSVMLKQNLSHDSFSAKSIFMNKNSGKDPEIKSSTYSNDISWEGNIDSNGQPIDKGLLFHKGENIFDGTYEDGHRNRGT